MNKSSFATVSPDRKASAVADARTHRLLEGPIGPTLLRLAAPNVLAMMFAAAISIAEAAFAGQLGVAALAGLALVFPLVMLTQMMSAGAIGGAISSSIARALGSGDRARGGRLVGAAVMIAIGAAMTMAIIVGLIGEPLFTALGGGDAAIAGALDYAFVYFTGCAAIWLCNALLGVIRGTGDMVTPSLVLVMVTVATIPMAGALALGWGPFPQLGMAGLAGGQIIANGIGALAATVYTMRGLAGLRITFTGLRGELFADILRIGLMSSLNAVLTVATIVIMVGLVGRHGPEALAGYGLGARLEFLMIPVVFGIGAALTAMIGASIGAGDRTRALRVGWTGAFSAAAIVGGIGLFFAAVPDLWLRIFLDAGETQALEAGRLYFRTVAPVYGFFALGLALYFASQGAGRMAWPLIASVLRMIVAISAAFLLGDVAELGPQGVFLGIALGMVTYGLVTATAIGITRWK